jgi:hypothetical protein
VFALVGFAVLALMQSTSNGVNALALPELFRSAATSRRALAS